MSKARSVVAFGRKFYVHIKSMKAFGLHPVYGVLFRRYAIVTDIEILIGESKFVVGCVRVK